MKKIAFLLLTLTVVFSLSGCVWLQFLLDVAASGPSAAIGNPYVQVAFEGEFSEEKLRVTIACHEEYFYPILYRDIDRCVSFETDHDISSVSVARLSRTDTSDPEVEISGYIDLVVECQVSGKRVDVIPAELSAIDLERCGIWSYLVCVRDTDGKDHYYYFRVDYSGNIPSRV